MATKNTERVKTFRVLRNGMRVGYSIRNFGDFMPEAAHFPNRRTLLNSDSIEEVWVDQEEFDEWKKDQQKRDEALAAGVESDDESDKGSDEVVDEEGSAQEEESRPAPAKKRRVAKKTTAKKKPAKKAVAAKGKSSGNLKQQSV